MITGLSLAEEQTYTTIGQHTLLHGESLFVITTTDAEHISLMDRNNNNNNITGSCKVLDKQMKHIYVIEINPVIPPTFMNWLNLAFGQY